MFLCIALYAYGGVMTRLRFGRRMNCNSIAFRDNRDFSFIRSVQISSGAHSACHFLRMGAVNLTKRNFFNVNANLSILLLSSYLNKLLFFFSSFHTVVLISLLVSMAVKHNNAFTNLVTGCLYWLTTCFGQFYDHHQVYKS